MAVCIDRAATCRPPGDRATGRRTVHAYFERGLRRRQDAPPGQRGPLCSAEPRLTIAFSLHIVSGRVHHVGFRATTCVTLVAYAELAAELTTGSSIAEARTITDTRLIAELPGVHPDKQDRATLVARALHAAIKTVSHIES